MDERLRQRLKDLCIENSSSSLKALPVHFDNEGVVLQPTQNYTVGLQSKLGDLLCREAGLCRHLQQQAALQSARAMFCCYWARGTGYVDKPAGIFRPEGTETAYIFTGTGQRSGLDFRWYFAFYPETQHWVKLSFEGDLHSFAKAFIKQHGWVHPHNFLSCGTISGPLNSSALQSVSSPLLDLPQEIRDVLLWSCVKDTAWVHVTSDKSLSRGRLFCDQGFGELFGEFEHTIPSGPTCITSDGSPLLSFSMANRQLRQEYRDALEHLKSTQPRRILAVSSRIDPAECTLLKKIRSADFSMVIIFFNSIPLFYDFGRFSDEILYMC